MQKQPRIHMTSAIPPGGEGIVPQSASTQGAGYKAQGPVRGNVLLPFELKGLVQKEESFEVWEGRDENNNRYRLLAVRDIDDSKTTQLLKRLNQFAHPSVLPFQVYLDAAQFLATTTLGEGSLRDLFEERWETGQSGLPQMELTEWIAGLALDLADVYGQYSFCHLWLTPENLVFAQGRLHFAYFGIGQFVWVGNRKRLSALNPGYFAPECLPGPFTHKSDQFSLAAIYVEMRTGKHPFAGVAREGRKSRRPERRGTLIRRTRAIPDLGLLSAKEQDVLMRALNPDPFNRYPNCVDFSEALLEALPPTSISFPEALMENAEFSMPAHQRQSVRQPPFLKTGSCPDTAEMPALPNFNEHDLTELLGPDGGTLPELASQPMPQFPTTISKLTLGVSELHRGDQYQFVLHPRQGLQHSFCTRLPFQDLLAAITTFQQDWQATIVHNQNSRLILIVKSAGIWGSLLGRSSEVMVAVRVTRKLSPSLVTAKVAVEVKSADENREHLGKNLRRVGPKLIESLRQYCRAIPEIRSDLRWSCARPIQVLHIFSELGMPVSLACMGKDISRKGIGFYAPQSLPRPDIFVHLPWIPEFQKTAVPAQVVRTSSLRNGWFEIGAAFPQT